jgi:predicted enzyme related to lactoylglutathione lyase
MTLQLTALCFDANDPLRLARFWAGVLHWELGEEADDVVVLEPTDGTRFSIDFALVPEPKEGQNRFHVDLSSTSVEAQRATVARAIDMGGRRIDIGQGPDAQHVVLADPEGNEFCVLESGNRFVDYGGVLGSITCVGSGPDVGYFWSEALGWPLVWDQDGETAIRAPDGTGQFITFGPPLPPKNGKNRLHFDTAPPKEGDQQAEVERLIALGATRRDIGQGDVPWVVMADPDDNEFCVLTPQ